MAAVDTNALIQASRCIDSCIPDGQKMAVIIYLLAQIAAVDPIDTKALLENSKCINSCIPQGAQWAVVIYLLSQWIPTG